MKTIFFDLDDTLYLRANAFYKAFQEFFVREKFNSDEFEYLMKKSKDTCRIRGDEVFYKCQRGEISMNEMYIYRFQQGFADCSIKITEQQALDFYSLYEKKLYSLKLDRDVIQMLNFAKTQFDKIGIITNGSKVHQRNKIKFLKLEKWLTPELIIISGEYKIDKPNVDIFKIAMEKSCKTSNQLIYVGDSYKNDIIPAKSLGWTTVWLDLYNEDFRNFDFRVTNIRELCCVLENVSK